MNHDDKVNFKGQARNVQYKIDADKYLAGQRHSSQPLPMPHVLMGQGARQGLNTH